MDTPHLPAGDLRAADLDERKAAILKAVVEEYVETAQPVGSGTIATSSHLGVSSATVRNEMTILEREGYLAQPHTSAGRVPTDRGYRFFVDHFTERGALPVLQRRAVSEFFASAHAALEELLHETSQLLSTVKAVIRFDQGSATPTCNLSIENGPGMLDSFRQAGLDPYVNTR
jgi:heat-inducible transcriptional repressor